MIKGLFGSKTTTYTPEQQRKPTPTSATAFERELAKANYNELLKPLEMQIDTLQRVIAKDGAETRPEVYLDLANLQRERERVRDLYRDLA